jgi:AraC-like DNA-binding protein
MVNLVLQGRKTLAIGGRTLHYEPATYFVASIELPAFGSVHAGPRGEPYLAVSLTLDRALLAGLLSDLPEAAPPRSDGREAGFDVALLTEDLVDAWTRMLRLMDSPRDIPALAPAYEREILYRVLQGPQGGMLRALASPGSAPARVGVAIRWIRQHFTETLPIEALAERAAMSPSAFHRHFKALTALSPLQYQKRLRLMHGRTLLLQHRNVAAAAFDAGYESASQFSREYARLFGLSPVRDLERIAPRSRRFGGGGNGPGAA